MDIGIQQMFTSYGWDNIADSDVYAQEKEITLLADELGFDTTWALEHHFTDYSFCPDNVVFLAWAAAKTRRITLGTGAVILPWNDPLRVAEKISMLDNLAEGRLKFGMGRGLSRREFGKFHGIELGESRERFDEASMMIVKALKDGVIEGSGKFYPQVKTDIRPRPERDFSKRIYAVANSKDSLSAAADIGAAIIMFAEKAWFKRVDDIRYHRELFQELHGREAPPIVIGDFTFCHKDAGYAREVSEQALRTYLSCILAHYELTSDHLINTPGYSAYGKQAESLQKHGIDKYIDGFLDSVAYGTPEQIIAKYKERRDIVGDYDLATSFRFGGLQPEDYKQSMQLFAGEVLPVVKRW